MNNIQRAILGVLESGALTTSQVRERLWALSNVTKVSAHVVEKSVKALERNRWIRHDDLGWVLKKKWLLVRQPRHRRESSSIAEIRNGVIIFTDGSCWAYRNGRWLAVADDEYRWQEGKLAKA